jgi:guanine deaminase
MCLGAIYWARPKAVYFGATKADAAQAGFDDSLIYKELALPMNLRSIPQERIGGVDSNQPFREWLEIVEKIEY